MDLDEFKKFLGPELCKEYKEEDLHRLRQEMYGIAKLLLEIYQWEKKKEETTKLQK